MATATFGLLVVFSASALFSAVCGVTCPQTADGCISAELKTLAKGDPNYYCEHGSVLFAASQNCLRDCKFSEDNTVLNGYKDDINSFCFKEESTCPNVADTYLNQTRCYDPYDGLAAVLGNITKAFEAGVTDLTTVCNRLYWGRSCQKIPTCKYNKNLDTTYVTEDHPEILLGLAICGSESLKAFLPYVEKSQGCLLDLDKTIVQKCNYSCDISNTVTGSNVAGLCTYLEKQAACLEENTKGCTAAQRKYVLPRLNSYAIANRYMPECHIKYNGITVKPTGEPVKYSELINLCLFRTTVENAINFDTIRPLLNRDIPVRDFCDTMEDKLKHTTDCRNEFIAAATPQSKLLTRQEVDVSSIDIDFVPEIGTFPLDSWGTAYIYGNLPDVCPKKLQWADGICTPDEERVTNPPTTIRGTKSNVTPYKSTAAPPASSTIKEDVKPGEGGITKNPNSAGGEDFLRNAAERSAMFSALLCLAAIFSFYNM